MKTIESSSFTVRIHLAGPIDVAKQYLRKYCLRGFCVSIQESHYVYTGGEESGYVVNLENYPRFPASQDQITETALNLCEELISETHQSSGMVVTPEKSYFISRRDDLPLKAA